MNCVGIWWDFCGKHTPVLRKYTIGILSQPCSTSFCRRYEEMAPPGDWEEDLSANLNTIIMSRISESLELEPIILDKIGEDDDDFKDVEELVDDYCFQVLPRFSTDDTFVQCMINYSDDRSWLDDDVCSKLLSNA